jgi:hypothetical protein
MSFNPFRPARDIISPLLGISSDSINHVDYEGLRARSIAVSIEQDREPDHGGGKGTTGRVGGGAGGTD